MPLTLIRRKSTGALTIIGTVTGRRLRQRAQTDDPVLAREEAASLEAQLLRAQWHGERRGARSFAQAVNLYLDAEPRSEGTVRRLNRILRALGDVALAAVTDEALIRARAKLFGATVAPATVRRGLVVPVRAVMRMAARAGWCEAPLFSAPRAPPGRTLYLLPDEAQRLVAHAAAHLRPLLVFLLGTGARMSEAIELDWRDVDLTGARAILWRTKTGRRRVAHLPPAVIAALAALPQREGQVFLWQRRAKKGRAPKHGPRPYADRKRLGGGQIGTAFAGALKRAGLDPNLTPHDLRHSWASWHYALHRDLLALKVEGAWSSVALVERYAHLMPQGHAPAIRAFWGIAAEGLEKRA
jgi:integrase